MIQPQKRIEWLDMAKGYGMILVIFAHLDVGLIGKWIYTFHMPLFFFLSGYVYSDKDGFATFFKKKFKSLIIPYFCLGIPLLLFNGLGHYIVGDYTIKDCLNLILLFFVQRRLWTMWFLACLFFVNILFYVVKKALKSSLKMTVLAIITVFVGIMYYKSGGAALPWNIDVCMMAYPFFLGGYFFRNNQTYLDKCLDNKKKSLLIFIIFGVLNTLCGYMSFRISGHGLNMFDSIYGFVPLTYISAFAGIICVIIISKKYLHKVIQYIGENTLVYFAWHQTIMIPISLRLLSFLNFRIDNTCNILSIALYKIFQLIFIILVLTLCNLIISKTKLKFMLGKI